MQKTIDTDAEMLSGQTLNTKIPKTPQEEIQSINLEQNSPNQPIQNKKQSKNSILYRKKYYFLFGFAIIFTIIFTATYFSMTKQVNKRLLKFKDNEVTFIRQDTDGQMYQVSHNFETNQTYMRSISDKHILEDNGRGRFLYRLRNLEDLQESDSDEQENDGEDQMFDVLERTYRNYTLIHLDGTKNINYVVPIDLDNINYTVCWKFQADDLTFLEQAIQGTERVYSNTYKNATNGVIEEEITLENGGILRVFTFDDEILDFRYELRNFTILRLEFDGQIETFWVQNKYVEETEYSPKFEVKCYWYNITKGDGENFNTQIDPQFQDDFAKKAESEQQQDSKPNRMFRRLNWISNYCGKWCGSDIGGRKCSSCQNTPFPNAACTKCDTPTDYVDATCQNHDFCFKRAFKYGYYKREMGMCNAIQRSKQLVGPCSCNWKLIKESYNAYKLGKSSKKKGDCQNFKKVMGLLSAFNVVPCGCYQEIVIKIPYRDFQINNNLFLSVSSKIQSSNLKSRYISISCHKCGCKFEIKYFRIILKWNLCIYGYLCYLNPFSKY